MSDALPVYPFGQWPSSISSSSVAEGALRFGRVQLADGAVYWSERRLSRKRTDARYAMAIWEGNRGADTAAFFGAVARARIWRRRIPRIRRTLYFVNDADQDVYGIRVCSEPASDAAEFAASQTARKHVSLTSPLMAGGAVDRCGRAAFYTSPFHARERVMECRN